MPKKITITIGTDGATVVKAEGYPGAACKDATRALEQALGTRTAERLTAEYHQPDSTKNTQRA